MRILLIEPAKSPISMAGEDVFLFESLALEYVAAGVSADHDVRILDQRIDDTVEQTLEEYRPDVVGITGYTVHANRMKLLAERAKTWKTEVLTVVGGHHATEGAYVHQGCPFRVVARGGAGLETIEEPIESGEKLEDTGAGRQRARQQLAPQLP